MNFGLNHPVNEVDFPPFFFFGDTEGIMFNFIKHSVEFPKDFYEHSAYLTFSVC